LIHFYKRFFVIILGKMTSPSKVTQKVQIVKSLSKDGKTIFETKGSKPGQELVVNPDGKLRIFWKGASYERTRTNPDSTVPGQEISDKSIAVTSQKFTAPKPIFLDQRPSNNPFNAESRSAVTNKAAGSKISVHTSKANPRSLSIAAQSTEVSSVGEKRSASDYTQVQTPESEVTILKQMEPFVFVSVEENLPTSCSKKINIEPEEMNPRKKIRLESVEDDQNQALPIENKVLIIKCLTEKITNLEQITEQERKQFRGEIVQLTEQIKVLSKQSKEMKGKLRTMKIENLTLNKMLVNMETKCKEAKSDNNKYSHVIKSQQKLLQTRFEDIQMLKMKNEGLQLKNEQAKLLATQILNN
jgi:hypothetical protein